MGKGQPDFNEGRLNLGTEGELESEDWSESENESQFSGEMIFETGSAHTLQRVKCGRVVLHAGAR